MAFHDDVTCTARPLPGIKAVVQSLPLFALQSSTHHVGVGKMLWLIWIVIMLAVPVFAGIDVWFRLHREGSEPQAAPVRTDESASA